VYGPLQNDRSIAIHANRGALALPVLFVFIILLVFTRRSKIRRRNRNPIRFQACTPTSIASGSGDWWTSQRSHPLTIKQYVDAILPPLTRLGPRILRNRCVRFLSCYQPLDQVI